MKTLVNRLTKDGIKVISLIKGDEISDHSLVLEQDIEIQVSSENLRIQMVTKKQKDGKFRCIPVNTIKEAIIAIKALRE